MITLFDEEEIQRTFIARERREAAALVEKYWQNFPYILKIHITKPDFYMFYIRNRKECPKYIRLRDEFLTVRIAIANQKSMGQKTL